MLFQKIIKKARRRLSKRLKTTAQFSKEFDLFNSLNSENRFTCLWEDTQPCLNDNTTETFFDSHYIYHPAWAVRVVKEINPEKHIDISSTLAFSTQLSAFIPVEFYDYRPAKVNLPNFASGWADLNNLPFKSSTVASISCMHTIEHIGLGRYGDKIDPDGDLKAFAELIRVVRPGGNLLIVVPLGKPRIKFNAHRIYSYEMIVGVFSNQFNCKDFSFVDDLGRFVFNANPQKVKLSNFGCGCFWFQKKG